MKITKCRNGDKEPSPVSHKGSQETSAIAIEETGAVLGSPR